MATANPGRNSALVNPKRFCSFLLSTEVIDQALKYVHLSPSNGYSHNVDHGNTHLQAYGCARNTRQMEFKDRLKAARKRANLTQSQLAEAVGISQTSITDLERGKSQSTAFCVQIAKACRVSAMWLATGEGEMIPPAITEDGKINLLKPWEDLGSHSNVAEVHQPHRASKEYPLISWVAAGCWQESCDNFQPGDAEEWISSYAKAGPHGYWLEVEGESMMSTTEFSFVEGMRVLVQPEGFDLINGKLYIAKLLSTGEKTFKKYVRDAGVEYLKPLNPAFRMMEITDDVRIIGRVIDASPPPSVF